MRRLPLCPLCLLSALVVSGGWPTPQSAAAAAQAQRSLSGVLVIPRSPELPVKDPFSPPAELFHGAGTGKDKTAGEELPRLQLTAIVWRTDQASAVVNGAILREGDQFMGMRVLNITRDQVHFQRGEGKLSLILHQTLYNALSSEGK